MMIGIPVKFVYCIIYTLFVLRNIIVVDADHSCNVAPFLRKLQSNMSKAKERIIKEIGKYEEELKKEGIKTCSNGCGYGQNYEHWLHVHQFEKNNIMDELTMAVNVNEIYLKASLAMKKQKVETRFVNKLIILLKTTSKIIFRTEQDLTRLPCPQEKSTWTAKEALKITGQNGNNTRIRLLNIFKDLEHIFDRFDQYLHCLYMKVTIPLYKSVFCE